MLPPRTIALALLLSSSPVFMVRPSRNSKGVVLALSQPPTSRRRSARISAAKSKEILSININVEGDSGVQNPSASEKRRKLNIDITARSSSTSTKSLQSVSRASDTNDNNNMPPLLNLGKLVRGSLVKRPSATVRSPYVADVALFKGKKKSAATVLAHAPALDVGGMCAAGSEVYLSERNGEGKTSHSIELVVSGAPLLSNNPNNDSTTTINCGSPPNGVLVGAHPRLGESIAEEVLKRGLLKSALPLQNGFELGPVNEFYNKKSSISSPKKKQRAKKGKQQANNDVVSTQQKVATATFNDGSDASKKSKIELRRQVTLGDSRVDFQITLDNPTLNDTSHHRVIFEVKNVVCADYEAGTEPVKTGPNHCVVVAPTPPPPSSPSGDGSYRRSALFPWGRTRGQQFEGKSVVSERACKHLRNLQSLLNNNNEDDRDGNVHVTPVVLFIVNRSDCESVRACHEKCPVFAEVLKDVVEAGVKALAVRVRWTEDGECFFDGVVPVVV